MEIVVQYAEEKVFGLPSTGLPILVAKVLGPFV